MMAVSISSWRADCSLGQARCLRDPFIRVFVRLASTRPTTSDACRRRSMHSGRLWPLPLKPVADGQVRQAEGTRKLAAGRLFWPFGPRSAAIYGMNFKCIPEIEFYYG